MRIVVAAAILFGFIKAAPIALDVDCSMDTGGCAEGDANSECSAGDGDICKCSTGFYDDNGVTPAGTCEAVVALNGDCSGSTIGNDACAGATANSECSGGSCICSAGFYDTTVAAGGTCEAVVALNGDCSGSTIGNTACSTSTANSECSGGVCACSTGFYDDTVAAGGSCEAVVALNGDCSGSTIGNTACSTSTANSECSGGACVCSSGFYDTTAGAGGTCDTVLGSTCTNDGAGNTLCATTRQLANSECSSSACACSSGFYADSNLCQAGIGLNGDCSAASAGVKDAACQAINAQTTCVTTGGNSLCTCNSGYFDSDGVGTTGGSCTAVLTTSCTDETNCGNVDTNAECTGTAGSKTCNCKSGYTGGSGDVCQLQSAGVQNTSSFWICASLVLLAAKSILL